MQDIPLNGRHFVDLALLIPGSVVPPANGFLTAPLRGQGSFSFNSAGAREDSVNFMINGVNLSDPNQNQITFQPTINTVEDFQVDNSTFSAEYGRNSGSIVNIATRSGVDQWHGEAYEFLRNNDLDARNFSNPTFTGAGSHADGQPPGRHSSATSSAAMPAARLQKDKTFIFLTVRGAPSAPGRTDFHYHPFRRATGPGAGNQRPADPEPAAADSGRQLGHQPVRLVRRRAREHRTGHGEFQPLFLGYPARQRLLRDPTRPA